MIQETKFQVFTIVNGRYSDTFPETKCKHTKNNSAITFET